ncbi:hypothetical protein [Mesomycoplasma hyopneumoniae]|uniref:hypothetical protein n=1 Tax=Mesomycoplasma hyopneumoniae TaxID=2099 RepID=UPI00136D5D1A|nr:hypothetical protein [Mesomycoplasma hyopneumoniae]
MSKVILPDIIELEVKKFIKRKKRKAFLRRILNFLSWLALPFLLIASIFWDIVGAFFLRLIQIILWFIAIGSIVAGIIYVITWLATL